MTFLGQIIMAAMGKFSHSFSGPFLYVSQSLRFESVTQT